MRPSLHLSTCEREEAGEPSSLPENCRSVSNIASAASPQRCHEGIEAYVLHMTSAALLCLCSQRHSARIVVNEWREGLLQMVASRFSTLATLAQHLFVLALNQPCLTSSEASAEQRTLADAKANLWLGAYPPVLFSYSLCASPTSKR